MLLRMAHFPQSHRGVRAPRVRVPQDELVHFVADGMRIKAMLRKISTTGGLAHLVNRLDAGTLAEIAIATKAGVVQGLVEMFPPMSDGSNQAFRFVALSDEDHERLAAIVALMNKQGYADMAKAAGF
jgi:hypothetical protein